MNYAQGAAALSPTSQGKPGEAATKKKKPGLTAEQEKKRAAAAKKSYESLLGSFLGGKLYEAMSKELSAEKLLGHGEKGVEGALGALTGLISPVDGFAAMDEKAEADAVKKFGDAIGKWAQEEAVEWLKSDDGKAFLTKVNHWFEGNPGWVVAIAMVAAAGAVAANIDIPKIKQKFKIGDNVTMSAGIDLNKIRDIAFKGATVGVQYAKDGFKAGAEYGYEAGEGDTADKHSLTASVGNKQNTLSTSASLQGEVLVIDTKGTHKGKGYSASAGLKHKKDGADSSNLANVGLKIGDKNENVTAAASYDLGTGALAINLGSLQQFGDLSLRNTAGYDSKAGQTHGIGIDAQLAEKFKLSLDYRMSEVQGQSLAVKGSKQWGEGNDQFSLTGSGKFNIDDGRVDSAKLGFSWRDKKEFSSIVAQLEHKYKDVPTTKLHLMAETTFGEIMVRGQNTTTLSDGNLAANWSQVHAAYAVTKDWTLYGGGKYGYQNQNIGGLNDSQRGAWVEAGAQFRGVALGISFRPEDKAVSFGITIPFGR